MPDWPDIIFNIVIIIVLSMFLYVVVPLILKATMVGVFRRTHKAGENKRGRRGKKEREQRLRTLVAFMSNLIRLSVAIVAVMLILPEFGISTGPLLASAGIFGVALGFGAQNLVRDAINGFFITLEDQYAIGDTITVEGVHGVVEDLGIRYTVLRGFDGAVHYIPNSMVQLVSNHSKDWSRVIVEIGVDMSKKVDRVQNVLEEVLKDFHAANKRDIKATPEYLGVEDFVGDASVVRLALKTDAAKQWGMKRKFLEYLQDELPKRRIPIKSLRRMRLP